MMVPSYCNDTGIWIAVQDGRDATRTFARNLILQYETGSPCQAAMRFASSFRIILSVVVLSHAGAVRFPVVFPILNVTLRQERARRKREEDDGEQNGCYKA